MSTESSVKTRRFKHFLIIENKKPKAKKEPSWMKYCFIVSLMGLSVLLTQITLALVKWVKRLEGEPS